MKRAGAVAIFTGTTAFLASFGALAGEPVIVEAGPDWDLILSGQIRPRFITHTGLDFRGDASEMREVVTQRARLGASLQEISGLGFTFQVQDVRIWGEEDSTLDFDANGLDVHQAFGTLPVVGGLDLHIGRQEFIIDNQRLVGAVDWSQRGRSFDGGRLAWTSNSGRYEIEGLYAKVFEPGQNPDGSVPDLRDGDVDFGGVHASIELFPQHEIAPVYLVNIKQAPNDVRHTTGLSARGERSGFDYSAEFFYQYGKIDEATIDAFMVAGRAGYTLDAPVAPALHVWGEALSGDGTLEGTFDSLYATNHKFYGEMDFFLNIPAHTSNLGLIDLGGRVGTGIVEGLRVHVDGHYFRTFDQTPDGETSLGTEIDLKVVYQAMDYVTLRALYGIFVPGEAMRTRFAYDAAQDLSFDSLAYVTLDVAF